MGAKYPIYPNIPDTGRIVPLLFLSSWGGEALVEGCFFYSSDEKSHQWDCPTEDSLLFLFAPVVGSRSSQRVGDGRMMRNGRAGQFPSMGLGAVGRD